MKLGNTSICCLLLCLAQSSKTGAVSSNLPEDAVPVQAKQKQKQYNMAQFYTVPAQVDDKDLV